MTATQRFIDDAMKGGFQSEDLLQSNPVYFFPTLLNPKAWQAVGKTRGWVVNEYYASFGNLHPTLGMRFSGKAYTVKTYQSYMQSLIDALIDGKTIEQYLLSIEKNV